MTVSNGVSANGHANGNGVAHLSNGTAKEANGHAKNGFANGHSNGIANGLTNGLQNGDGLHLRANGVKGH